MSGNYSICVIDDMEEAVESLVKNIRWQDYGISVTGTATNGKEGLELALRLKPDMILTDIRMPHMDGLEMVSLLLQELPQCKIIIMSGYSDFNYAQKALKLGAIDYLMKPLTPQELGQTLVKVLQQLGKERQHKDQKQKLDKTVYQSMPLLKREQLNMLIRYETSRNAAESRWANLQLHLGSGRFVVMVAEVDNWSAYGDQLQLQEVETVLFTIQNIWEETIRGGADGVVFPDAYSNRLVSIVPCTEHMDLRKMGEDSLINIRNHSKYSVSIGVSEEAGIEQLPQAYNQALKALSNRFYTEGNCLIGYSDVYPGAGKAEALKLVNAAVDYIEETLGDHLTIGDYAARVHLSPSYFAGLFKKTKGMTVHQYVLKAKIKAAQELLLQNKQVQEIAVALGFEDRRYFTEVFKKMTGITPTDFMKKGGS